MLLDGAGFVDGKHGGRSAGRVEENDVDRIYKMNMI